ncbi:IS66 family insertion sequence element accessory protein TnpB [Pseudomonas aeruginosa]|uniref:IS66 family insertion sequence element accessory protein TnpB n=1 Tax=Pseudomonas aeruginosa TaxID=287 RepID=UPI000A4D0320|nr:IS66 family insertion sequence element accessory protein TnpB [Pseudomonas aeruginosa]
MMRPDSKVEKIYLYPKPVDFRKSIDGLAALVELNIKIAVFDPLLFVFLIKARNRIKARCCIGSVTASTSGLSAWKLSASKLPLMSPTKPLS